MPTRRLVLGVVLAAAGLAAVVVFWPTPRRQALARVEALGGTYTVEDVDDADGPRRVVSVVLTHRQPADADLAVLREIRPLHRVMLDCTPVTDAGLAHLAGIDELEWVSVCNTAVTDAGLAHLRALPGLRSVHARKTAVSDAGLVHLHGHPRLVFVNVAESRVTDDGAEALRRATPGLTRVYLHVATED